MWCRDTFRGQEQIEESKGDSRWSGQTTPLLFLSTMTWTQDTAIREAQAQFAAPFNQLTLTELTRVRLATELACALIESGLTQAHQLKPLSWSKGSLTEWKNSLFSAILSFFCVCLAAQGLSKDPEMSQKCFSFYLFKLHYLKTPLNRCRSWHILQPSLPNQNVFMWHFGRPVVRGISKLQWIVYQAFFFFIPELFLNSNVKFCPKYEFLSNYLESHRPLCYLLYLSLYWYIMIYF